MRRLTLQIMDRQLTLRRDRRKDFLCLLGIGGATLLYALCVLRVPGGGAVSAGSRLPLLAFGLLLCAAFGWRLSLNLRRQEWVVDRASGRVLLNERPVMALGELESVCLDRGRYDSTGVLVLYLRTRGRVQWEIARDDGFGVGTSEMREIADALAAYAGLNLVTPDGFRPGHVGKRRRRLRKTPLTPRRQARRTKPLSGLKTARP